MYRVIGQLFISVTVLGGGLGATARGFNYVHETRDWNYARLLKEVEIGGGCGAIMAIPAVISLIQRVSSTASAVKITNIVAILETENVK